MKPTDLIELMTLAAVWGASFLFMRMGAGEFGAVALAAVRVTGAALFLLPLAALRGQWPALRQHWKPILVVGVVNSALPFLGFSYAALSITAGLSSIFNASSPLWVALIGACLLGERLAPARVLGLVVGFAGVAWLAWDKASFQPGGSGWAVVAYLGAAACYGVAAIYTRRRLAGVAPLAVAAGSQLTAALALLVPALVWWPAVPPSQPAWIAAALLELLCTGAAYLLYFRLIAHVGAANAIAVTFLIPAFAVLWGGVFLGERVTPAMVAGCAVILAGTALATGVLRLPRWAAS